MVQNVKININKLIKYLQWPEILTKTCGWVHQNHVDPSNLLYFHNSHMRYSKKRKNIKENIKIL